MQKTALVTGATAGIGKAVAETLARNGYNLILTGRREALLEDLCFELEKDYKIITHPLNFDVRDREAVKAAAEEIQKRWGKIDVLVNNAGLALGLSHMNEGDPDDWDTMIDTNIKGLLYVTRYTFPMLKEAGGHIINIGSIAGKEIYPNGNVYCAAKHAVDALSKSMRLEFSSYPVKVSAVHPGAVETEFSLVRFKGDSDKAATVYNGFENLVAEDIAEAAMVYSQPAPACKH